MTRAPFLIPWLLLAGACVTSHPDSGYPVVEVEDPDPEKDPESAKFCNPSGKQGADLVKCNEYNESQYKEFDEEAKQREPWFNFTPESWADTPELDPALVSAVTPSREKDAVAKLEKAPQIELQSAEVEAFTGKKDLPSGKKAFLVRGLYYFKDTGGFSVFEKDSAILVRHDSVGSQQPSETRSAVVVFLEHPPKAVYVDCSVAE